MFAQATKKVVFSCMAVMGALQGAEGMYASDKGKNEWHLETLGELSDLVLFADSEAYTLSTDGLLSLFDTKTQTISWKKQLPQGKFEDYQLRHMGRNLIAHSDERVAMINS